MTRFLLPTLTLLAVSAWPAWGQYYRSSWSRHHLYGGLGVTVPQHDLEPLYSNSFGGTMSYGYRFHRNFQADVGLDIGYNAANVNDYLDTSLGSLRIRDFQYFVPVGGRTVIPISDGRVELHAGGGFAYLRYSERLKQPSDYYRVGCPVCQARDGVGYYGLVGIDFALTRGQALRFGVFTRIVQGHTEGAAVGQATDRTRDRWINSFATLSLCF